VYNGDIKLTGKIFTKVRKGAITMATNRKKNSMETCPLCGLRRRDPKCLVCRDCNETIITPLKDKIEGKNATALLDERPDDVVNPWDRIFDLVLEKGKETITEKQAKQKELIELRRVRELELPGEAELKVAAVISSYRKGGDKNACRLAEVNRSALIVAQLDRLKKKDKTFREAHGIGKAILSIHQHLEGVRQKRREHAERQTKSSAELEIVEVSKIDEESVPEVAVA